VAAMIIRKKKEDWVSYLVFKPNTGRMGYGPDEAVSILGVILWSPSSRTP
jgi:hypothetical protein